MKQFSSERCDWLFVLVWRWSAWFIPAAVWAEATGSCSGGRKYTAYEVEPGRPLSEGSPPDRYTRHRPAGFPSGQRGAL